MIKRLSKTIKEVDENVRKFGTVFSKMLSEKPKHGKSRKNLEHDIADIATVLVNMLLIGKEKAYRCKYYNHEEGICMFQWHSITVPTLNYVNKNGTLYLNVARNPEICAACPYWSVKQE